MRADTIPRRWKRRRTGSFAGYIQGSLGTPRLGMGPALFRLEPPSGLGLLFLLPRSFLVDF